MSLPIRHLLPAGVRRRPPVLQRYVLDGERIVLSTHLHWASIAEPVASTVLGLAFALWFEAGGPLGGTVVSQGVWLGWLTLLARALWLVVEWRRSWFIATEKRLLLTYGVLTERVAMMPLPKVTDMSYSRSVPGRLLGYGTFVMESAGQNQALHQIRWIDHPDRTYRAICAEIFGVDDRARVLVEEGTHDDRPPLGGPVHRTADTATDRPAATTGSGGVPPQYSRPIPVRETDGESLYRSPDLRRRDDCPDTGPIVYYAPGGTDRSASRSPRPPGPDGWDDPTRE